MKFSVVIPVFNGENCIAESMYSVLNQTYGDVELIVVNDGSSDRTHEIISGIVAENSARGIIYRNMPNGGPAKARNVGLEAATGDYVCFLDADDEYDLRLFEELCGAIDGADVCFFGWTERKNGKEVFRYTDAFSYLREPVTGKEAAFLKAEKKIWLCNCNEVYSLAMIKKYGIKYFESAYSGEDANFIYKCLARAEKVTSLEKEYFVNHLIENSLMRSEFSEKCLTEFASTRDLYDYAVKNGLDEELKDLFFSLYYHSRIYVAKRIAKAMPVNKAFAFSKECRKYIPKMKKERRLILSKKERAEEALFKLKPLFFWIYKRHCAKNEA